MPELPEVEVLARHLAPLLIGKVIHGVTVRRAKVIAPLSPLQLIRRVRGATIRALNRRGKYLVFQLQPMPPKGECSTLLGHLGMTGRMYVQPADRPLPRHAVVVLNLGRQNLVFEDQRYFGRITFATAVLRRLGPEPLGPEFTAAYLRAALQRSRQAVKVKLLDQSLVAGIGNIYANEALFRAGISPFLPAKELSSSQVHRLRQSIRLVLAEAIAGGSTVPLDWAGTQGKDRLFYFGRAADTPDYYEERLRVYDRAGQPCARCRHLLKRIVQGGRSTFFCPNCQARIPHRSRATGFKT